MRCKKIRGIFLLGLLFSLSGFADDAPSLTDAELKQADRLYRQIHYTVTFYDNLDKKKDYHLSVIHFLRPEELKELTETIRPHCDLISRYAESRMSKKVSTWRIQEIDLMALGLCVSDDQESQIRFVRALGEFKSSTVAKQAAAYIFPKVEAITVLRWMAEEWPGLRHHFHQELFHLVIKNGIKDENLDPFLVNFLSKDVPIKLKGKISDYLFQQFSQGQLTPSEEFKNVLKTLVFEKLDDANVTGTFSPYLVRLLDGSDEEGLQRLIQTYLKTEHPTIRLRLRTELTALEKSVPFLLREIDSQLLKDPSDQALENALSLPAYSHSEAGFKRLKEFFEKQDSNRLTRLNRIVQNYNPGLDHSDKRIGLFYYQVILERLKSASSYDFNFVLPSFAHLVSNLNVEIDSNEILLLIIEKSLFRLHVSRNAMIEIFEKLEFELSKETRKALFDLILKEMVHSYSEQPLLKIASRLKEEDRLMLDKILYEKTFKTHSFFALSYLKANEKFWLALKGPHALELLLKSAKQGKTPHHLSLKWLNEWNTGEFTEALRTIEQTLGEKLANGERLDTLFVYRVFYGKTRTHQIIGFNSRYYSVAFLRAVATAAYKKLKEKNVENPDVFWNFCLKHGIPIWSALSIRDRREFIEKDLLPRLYSEPDRRKTMSQLLVSSFLSRISSDDTDGRALLGSFVKGLENELSPLQEAFIEFRMTQKPNHDPKIEELVREGLFSENFEDYVLAQACLRSAMIPSLGKRLWEELSAERDHEKIDALIELIDYETNGLGVISPGYLHWTRQILNFESNLTFARSFYQHLISQHSLSDIVAVALSHYPSNEEIKQLKQETLEKWVLSQNWAELQEEFDSEHFVSLLLLIQKDSSVSKSQLRDLIQMLPGEREQTILIAGVVRFLKSRSHQFDQPINDNSEKTFWDQILPLLPKIWEIQTNDQINLPLFEMTKTALTQNQDWEEGKALYLEIRERLRELYQEKTKGEGSN